METLRFAPPQSPLLHTKFTGNHGTASAAARSSVRWKPLTYAALPKSAAEILRSLEKVSTSALFPPAAEKPLLRVSPSSMQFDSGYLLANEKPDDGAASKVALNAKGYLQNILSSKVYDVVNESPLEQATELSGRLGVNVWLKREDMQPEHSFKLRGAYNMMASLPNEQQERGVVSSSPGNHAQGVALSAQKLGSHAAIFMPVTTPEVKVKSLERLGATVVIVGDSYDEAQAYAKRWSLEEGHTYIPPSDHPDVIAGQGTIGMEIIRQMKGPTEAIFVPIGGGGLAGGIAAYVKSVYPDVKIIGVQPHDANAMALSLHHGQRVKLDQVGDFADAVEVTEVGEETYDICSQLLDGVVLVSNDEISAAIKDMFEEKKTLLEPAGALALAGAEAYCKYYGLKDADVVAVTSGANVNLDSLRLVSGLEDIVRRSEDVLKAPGRFISGLFD